jgi:hypothetical protein
MRRGRERRRARRVREWMVQGAAALLLVAVALGFAHNIAVNLEARQIKSGFDFLQAPAGFNIGEVLFEFSARPRQLSARVRGRHGQHAAGRARRHRARERARRRRGLLRAVAPPVCWPGSVPRSLRCSRNVPLLIHCSRSTC